MAWVDVDGGFALCRDLCALCPATFPIHLFTARDSRFSTPSPVLRLAPTTT